MMSAQMTLRVQLILTLIIVCFAGCQHDIEEIDSGISKNNISVDSDLAQLITYSTLKDGSFDNILDNASSISVKLPVSVVANTVELNIESTADFTRIEEIYDEEPYLKDSLLFVYPITVVNSDYSELTVENKAQLDQIVAESIEGGEDPDIECYSYEYPVKLSIYDQLNQLASTISIEKDQDLYSFISGLNEDEIVALEYPLTFYDLMGERIVINNNDRLETTLNDGLNACEEGDIPYYKDDDVYLPTARLNILLTDAPFPTDLIAEANVTINQILLKIDDDAEEDSLITISEEVQSFNLLELTNGLTASLADIEVPIGDYDEIRLIVPEASVLLNDGELFDLKVPSGSTSGIKVKLNPSIGIAEGDEYQILLDFDVSQSFVVKGNPNSPAGIKGFNFKPVIKAANLAMSGSISGEVTDETTSSGIDGVEISVFAADTLNTTTFTNENGEYKILGLAAGTYEVTADHDDYDAQTISDIAVEIEEDTKVNFELTQK